MATHLCALVIVATLLSSIGGKSNPQSPATDKQIRAAIVRCARAVGYRVTDRSFGNDEEVVSLEDRDAKACKPLTRMYVRLRSLRPAPKSSNLYFRYWLFRETYDSEENAERRVKEYMTGYEDRLATAIMTSHMVSKYIIRVGAKQRGNTVYLLVTNTAFTLFDDRRREKILDTVVNARDT